MKNISLNLLILSAFALSCREEPPNPAWWDEPLAFAGDDALSGVELPITLCTIANPAQVVAIAKLVKREMVRHTDCSENRFRDEVYGMMTLEIQGSSDLTRLPLQTILAVDVSGHYYDRMLVTLSQFDGEWVVVSRFQVVESSDGSLSAVDDAIFDFPTTWNGIRAEVALNNADYSNRCKAWTPQDEAAYLDNYLGPGQACEKERRSLEGLEEEPELPESFDAEP
jgi:hypothetical protein